uniref:Uncharacterized protein n=1 Tax=Clytia hemisphaerica TaxID=252671 RepID=A0A7M5V6Z8_9CNID
MDREQASATETTLHAPESSLMQARTASMIAKRNESETTLTPRESMIMQARTANMILKKRDSTLFHMKSSTQLHARESSILHPKASTILHPRASSVLHASDSSSSDSQLYLKAKTKRIEQFEARLGDQKQIILKQRQRLRDYNSQIKEKDLRINKLTSEMKEREVEFDKFKKVNNEKIKKLETEVKTLNEKNQGYSEILKDQDKFLKSFQKELTEELTSRDIALKKAQEIEAKNAEKAKEVEGRLSSKDDEITSLKKRVEALTALLQEQKREKDAELSGKEAALEAANIKIAGLEDELKQASQKDLLIESQKEEIATKNEKLQKLEVNLKSTDAEKLSLEAALGELQEKQAKKGCRLFSCWSTIFCRKKHGQKSGRNGHGTKKEETALSSSTNFSQVASKSTEKIGPGSSCDIVKDIVKDINKGAESSCKVDIQQRQNVSKVKEVEQDVTPEDKTDVPDSVLAGGDDATTGGQPAQKSTTPYDDVPLIYVTDESGNSRQL